MPTKQEARAVWLNKRKGLSLERIAAESELLVPHLNQIFQESLPRVVGVYRSTPRELSLDPWISQGISQGISGGISQQSEPRLLREGDSVPRFAFPVPLVRGNLSATQWQWRLLKPGVWGESRFWEEVSQGWFLPSESALETDVSDRVELVLVPGLAFDSTGARLGRGRGHYDRLLALPEASAAKKVGVCSDDFFLRRGGKVSAEVKQEWAWESESWDCKMDGVLTPSGYFPTGYFRI